MSSSKPQGIPANLKERIAALEQRNVSSSPHTSSAGHSLASSNTALRDKIAKFERKGGIPVPRGSFGLGAPPLAENSPPKKRGELYGNRISGTSRVTSANLSTSCGINSPLDTSRSFSVSAVRDDLNSNDARSATSLTSTPSSPSSSRGLSEDNNGSDNGTQSTSSCSIRSDADKHTKSIHQTTEAREHSPPCSTIPPPRIDEAKILRPSIQSIILSQEATSDHVHRSTDSTSQQEVLNDPAPDIPKSSFFTTGGDHGLSLANTSITDGTDALAYHHAGIRDHDPGAIRGHSLKGSVDSDVQSCDVNSHPSNTDSADRMVENPHLNTSSIEPYSSTNSAEQLPSPPDKCLQPSNLSAEMGDSDGSLFTSRRITGKAIGPAICVVDESEKITTSEGLQQVGSFSHRNRPVMSSESHSQNIPDVEARTVSGGVTSLEDRKGFPEPVRDRNTSDTTKFHARSESSVNQPSFSAVVYKKVADVPVLPSSGATAAFYSTPTTPEIIQDDGSTPATPLLSPGFADLTTLLTNVNLSEQSPRLKEHSPMVLKLDTSGQDGIFQVNEGAEGEWNEHGANLITEKSSRNKSKGRHTMLRSKTWKKDGSSEVQVNPARSQSFLTFRSGQESRQGILGLQRELKSRDSETSSQKSSATMSRSPRQYLASLRRLAGGSNSSTPTLSRYSVSTSSEMSSEDSAWLPTPPSVPLAGSNEGEFGWNMPLPHGSPKKGTSTLNRAATFADRMLGRSRTKSAMSIKTSASETIVQSSSNLLPPLESLSYKLDIPDLPGPPDSLLPPGQQADTYPDYHLTPNSAQIAGASHGLATSEERKNNRLCISYQQLFPELSTITDLQENSTNKGTGTGIISPGDLSPPMLSIPNTVVSSASDIHSPSFPDSPAAKSLLSTPEAKYNTRDSWISGDSSTDASILIPKPLVDSFPSVPPLEFPPFCSP